MWLDSKRSYKFVRLSFGDHQTADSSLMLKLRVYFRLVKIYYLVVIDRPASKEMITTCFNTYLRLLMISKVCRNINWWSSKFQTVSLVHTYRESNRAAHMLAKKAHPMFSIQTICIYLGGLHQYFNRDIQFCFMYSDLVTSHL